MKTQSSKQYFQNLNIIFVAIILAIISFAAVVLMLNPEQLEVDSQNHSSLLLILVPIFMVASIFLSIYISSLRMKNITEQTNLADKLTSFRTTFIIKLAILEAPALFAIIAYMLTRNISFLIMAGIMICFIILQYPNKENILKILKITQSQRIQLENNIEI